MSGSCLLNDLEGLPLGVRAEFRIQLRRKGVLMPMVYKGTFLLANHEQNVCRNV